MKSNRQARHILGLDYLDWITEFPTSVRLLLKATPAAW